jgi:hypothetical protein
MWLAETFVHTLTLCILHKYRCVFDCHIYIYVLIYLVRKKTFEMKINNVGRDSSVGEVAKLRPGRASDQMPAGFQIFLFSVASKRAVRLSLSSG